MAVRLIPATDALVPAIVDCGRRAFANDALEHAMFPDRSDAVLESHDVLAYRRDLIHKRLRSPGCHSAVAVIDTPDTPGAPHKVVGFVGWLAPPEDSPEDSPEADKQPEAAPANVKGMDVDAFQYIRETVEKTKKEIFGDGHPKIWYLASLAIDPDFQGQGIGSKLVQWGLDKVDASGLPAYVMASPVAVGVYGRLGFKTVRTMTLVRGDDDGRSLSTFMLRPARSGAVAA